MYLSNLRSIAIIAILHAVGLYGLTSWYGNLFLDLTPLNLLITALIFWLATKPEKRTKYMGGAWAAIFAIGWGVEWLGVHTGLIFGEYAYGPTLGVKFFNIPLVIGVNWIIVTLSAYAWASVWISTRWGRVLLGSAFMVLLDVAIEPVAIRYNYWQWAEGVVPLKNYLGWFVVSLAVTGIWSAVAPKVPNRTHQITYFVLFLFFLTLNVFIYVGLV